MQEEPDVLASPFEDQAGIFELWRAGVWRTKKWREILKPREQHLVIKMKLVVAENSVRDESVLDAVDYLAELNVVNQG